jgi:hypothetical protein
MKRISKERVNKIAEALGESGLMTMVSTKGVLFFPIDTPEKVSESDTGVILLETKKEGSAALVKPGLIVSMGDRDKIPSVLFGYATTEYAAHFEVADYHSITGDKGFLSEEQISELNDLECFMLKKESVMVAFELGAEFGEARD